MTPGGVALALQTSLSHKTLLCSNATVFSHPESLVPVDTISTRDTCELLGVFEALPCLPPKPSYVRQTHETTLNAHEDDGSCSSVFRAAHDGLPEVRALVKRPLWRPHMWRPPFVTVLDVRDSAHIACIGSRTDCARERCSPCSCLKHSSVPMICLRSNTQTKCAWCYPSAESPLVQKTRLSTLIRPTNAALHVAREDQF